MKILITNDDGIEAEGIARLVTWAKTIGEVTVVGPKVEQSAKSQAIEFHRPIEAKKSDVFEGIRCFSVDSTPADCVRFAFIGLQETFDLVLSGINRGFNLGSDILYSGTVGAAFEAVNFGTKAISFSAAAGTLEQAATKLDTVYSFIMEHHLFNHSSLYNVNIPLEDKGIRIVKQGRLYYSDHFISLGNDLYNQKGYLAYTPSGDLTLDTDALMAGYITVMPLTTDRTDISAYEAIKYLT